jgi:hypothetical protein
MNDELKGKKAEIASKEKIALMQSQTDERLQIKLQTMKDATTIAVAHINAAAKGIGLDAHAAEEAQALGHEGDQAEHDRAHEVGVLAMQQAEAAKARQHQAAMAAAGAAAAIDQQAAGHDQALEQATHAAALEPEPAPDQAGV